jgi:uncharacterized membrane protein
MADSRPDFTVCMTKGTHVVSCDVAMLILEAIRSGAKDVTVTLQSFGDGTPIKTTLVVNHIVSLMQHNEEMADFDNVRFLRR